MEKKKFQKRRNHKKPAVKHFTKNSDGAKQIFTQKIKGGVREDAEIKELQSKYSTINVKSISKFSDFPLSRKTIRGLQECKYVKPTAIQQQSIGYALQGKDVLGAAITGSGKTLGSFSSLVVCTSKTNRR